MDRRDVGGGPGTVEGVAERHADPFREDVGGKRPIQRREPGRALTPRRGLAREDSAKPA